MKRFSEEKQHLVKRLSVACDSPDEYDDLWNDFDFPEYFRCSVTAIDPVRVKSSQGDFQLELKDDWQLTVLSIGDIINVIKPKLDGSTLLVDRDGFVVLHPDLLFSTTAIAQSFTCLRRSVISDRFSFPERNASLLYGSLLHELFERSVESDEPLDAVAGDIILQHMDELYALKLTRNQVLTELQKHYDKIKAFHARKLNVVDVEENIWSAKWGLKGKIDMTIKQSSIVPFELKTGRANQVAHRAQTTLYTLMVEDRYEQQVDSGLLFYLASDEMVNVECVKQELVGLIMRRNELALWCKDKDGRMPELLGNDRICQKCFAKAVCDRFSTGEPFEADQMSDVAWLWFKRWNKLVSLEEIYYTRNRKEIWTLTGKEREALGRCWDGLVILNEEILKGRRFGRFKYRMQRATHTGPSFLDSRMNVGDAVVISSGRRIALAIGYVAEISNATVSLTCDRSIRCGKGTYYRIDADVFSSGMASIRSNLMSLLLKKDRLRDLIVYDLKPEFTDQTSELVEKVIIDLNPAQKQAIRRAIQAQDYLLILGMPGAGKSLTIARLVKCLYMLGKTVLICAYTHSALDHLLFKVLEQKVKFIRLGQPEKVSEQLQEFMPKLSADEQELYRKYDATPIVAATCLSTNHPLFMKRQFDYVIVDEAAQISLPVVMGPLLQANRFVLVGDQNQLPPVVQCPEARASEGKHGLDTSLFEILAKKNPSYISELNFQYRMNEGIMELSNKLFYNGKLKCGTEEVAKQSMPTIETQGIFSTVLQQPVTFIDTDGEAALDQGDSNLFEANLVSTLVDFLISNGVKRNEIGISSPYRSQLKQICSLVQGVETLTVDQFQGKEKDVMLISFVKSNSEGNLGELLKDWRRLNVALTRARKSLILIGSCRTLCTFGIYKQMIQIIQSRDGLLSLSEEKENVEVFANE